VTALSNLAALFVAHLQHGATPPAPGGLEGDVARYLAAARAAWPALPLDVSVFVQHVAERATDGLLPPLNHAADLYLACACAHHVPGAHDAFDRHCGEAIARAVSRKSGSAVFVDEVTQRLRERLFVSSQGLPKIAEYRGRAALRTWLTIAASREALMLLRGEARRRKNTEVGDAPAIDDSPELALLKRRYAEDFGAALAHAFRRLSDKERTILQLQVVEQLGIDALGALYKVGRSTAARWLAGARGSAACVDARLNADVRHEGGAPRTNFSPPRTEILQMLPKRSDRLGGARDAPGSTPLRLALSCAWPPSPPRPQMAPKMQSQGAVVSARLVLSLVPGRRTRIVAPRVRIERRGRLDRRWGTRGDDARPPVPEDAR
jgi:RNA polymerase sigma-70 factor (ECF subfamily)